MLSILAACLAGAGTAVAAWLLARPLADAPAAPATLGHMPWAWRAAWPWLSAVAKACGPWLPWRLRARLARAVAQAGLPAEVTAAHAAALVGSAALLGMAAGAALAWWAGSLAAVPWLASAGAMLGGGWPVVWAHNRARRRRRRIGRELPFVLDMMTLCVESGLGLHGALQQAEQHGPPGPLRQELARALADMRAGMPRAAALKALAERADDPAVRSWVAALTQAEGLGMSMGSLLRGQAAQCRTDRFQRAEKLAMEAPVKMLLPLIGCIFPCTFIVLAFPIAVQLWQATQ
ncbi:type II secretion system F family protein [Bordetella petrii]|uniref:Type II secretion system F family protein n=1 Tax=Bordetella petrii TaxID=94624 RepID=A0ABT7W0M3_9BORD|nr:type II secretion system F family protein [Bordetella petrii]MDM9558709.1 type II secretion system F family protein [Bordetella petrii]